MSDSQVQQQMARLQDKNVQDLLWLYVTSDESVGYLPIQNLHGQKLLVPATASPEVQQSAPERQVCISGSVCLLYLSLCVCLVSDSKGTLYTHTHTHTRLLSLVLVVMMTAKELKTKNSHAYSLILSVSLYVFCIFLSVSVSLYMCLYVWTHNPYHLYLLL